MKEFQPSKNIEIITHAEIERKFCIKDLDQLPASLTSLPHYDIEQFYLTIDGNTENRIRKEVHQDGTMRYLNCQKIGNGLKRKETETLIDKAEYETLRNQSLLPYSIDKTRYLLPYQNLTIEIDIYKNDHLKDLYTAEIEFKSETEANCFFPPKWLGFEVTDNNHFKNRSLLTQNPFENSPDLVCRVPRFDKEPGIQHLKDLIDDKLKTNNNQPIIVEIAGGSASGKSTIAKLLKEFYKDKTIILTMDDYFRGYTFNQKNNLNFDQPQAIDIPLIKEHLALLKQGKSITKPVYSFKTGETEKYETLKPAQIILIEGLFAINNELKDSADIKTFINIGTHGQIIRRFMRDVVRSSFSPQDILGYFAEIVAPMHKKYIQSTINNADFVIENEYNAAIEAQRSGLRDQQLKFPTSLTEPEIQSLGGRFVSKTKQVDYYYNPSDRNLSKTGEIFRIRKENSDIILTYKGPNTHHQEIDRPKFEVKINNTILNKLIIIYGDCFQTITKTRTIFEIDDTLIHYDHFDNTKQNYLEFSPKVTPDTLKKFKLNRNESLGKSYIEML